MTQLAWLADAIRDEGASVSEHTGWKTRTMRPFAEYQPVGLIDHHTAGSSILTNYPDPPYYSNTSLETKCNITIRPDGLVVCLNAGWAHDSGYGDKNVLAAVQADKVAPAPSDTYSSLNPVTPEGSNPGILGNKYFIDIEVQHLGNGDPIAPSQLEALILTNAAICRQLGWDPSTRLLGHREWTKRKTDPRWNGFASPMPGIRTDTIRQLEGDDMTPEQENALNTLVALLQSRATDPPPWGAGNWQSYLDEVWTGPTTSDPGPLNPVTHIQLAKVYGVLKQVVAKAAPDVDVDAVIAEIVDRLDEDG